MAACALDVKNLVVYFDHEDLYDSINWDDVVANPVSELPKVISPCKVQFAKKNRIEKLPVFYTNLENIRVDQAIDNETESGSKEYELWDTDNEIEEGDVDLFEDLVYSHVNVVKDNKKAKGSKLKILVVARPAQGIEEEDTDDEGLDLPESDGEGDVRLRFTSSSEVYTFHVGLFPSIQKVREAITEYNIRNGVEIKLPKNDKTRVKVHCAEGCPWNLYVSLDSRSNFFVVKTYYGVHNCQKEWVLKRCTAKWFLYVTRCLQEGVPCWL